MQLPVLGASPTHRLAGDKNRRAGSVPSNGQVMGRASNRTFGLAQERRSGRADRRASRTSRPRRWADEVLEGELRNYVGEGQVFPTSLEFDRAGRSDLRSAVRDFGGAAYWAERLGLRLRPGQSRSPYEREDAIRDARAVLEAQLDLPNTTRLRQLGFPRLASYIVKRGGVARFLAEHDLG